MSKLLIAVLGALLVVSVGCQSNPDKGGGAGDPKMMSTDACPKCKGVQKAKADGSCPICGAKATSAAGDPKMMSTDACTHCPGPQVATADGKYPMCKMDLAQK